MSQPLAGLPAQSMLLLTGPAVKDGEGTGLFDLFAALLGEANPGAGGAMRPRPDRAQIEQALAALFAAPSEMSPGGDIAPVASDANGAAPSVDLAALAEALGPTPPAAEAVAEPEIPALFTDLLDRLVALQDSLAAGESPDETLLARVADALEELATALDLPLPAAPTPLPHTAPLPGPDATPRERLLGALADLARILSPPPDGPPAPAAQRVAAALAGLHAALSNPETAEPLATKLGLLAADGAAPDAEIEARIAALLAARTPAAVPVPAPRQGPDPRLVEIVAARETLPGDAGPEAMPDARPRLVEIGRGAAAQPAPAEPAPSAGETEALDTLPVQHAARAEQAAPGPRPVLAGYQTSQQQLNLPQIAFELVRQVQQGHSQFQLRLDPPELGRIEVRLDIDKAGNLHARLTVDRAETLDLMQRDQRALERALAQAGLDQARTSLEFALRQNPSGRQDQGRPDHGHGPAFDPETGTVEETAPVTVNLYRGALLAGGIDILA